MGPPEVTGLSTLTRLIRHTGGKLFLTGEMSFEYVVAWVATQLLFEVLAAAAASQGTLNDGTVTPGLVNGGPMQKLVKIE